MAVRPQNAMALAKIIRAEGMVPIEIGDQSAESLVRLLENGVDCILSSEEAITAEFLERLTRWGRDQPDWSALPVLVLTSDMAQPPFRLGALFRAVDPTGLQFSLLPRPAHADVARNAIRNAIGSRQRQYRIRDQLEAMEVNNQRIRLLSREVQHRAKNNLARVTAILELTWRNAGSPEEFIDSLRRRIEAMARGLDLLSGDEWKGANLIDLVETEFRAALGKDELDRLVVDGEHISLESRMALALHLVLHELTTNALKYGSLSVEGGRIRVEWSTENGDGGDALLIRWSEEGGPLVAKPTRKGFGSRLIERSLSEVDGEAELTFAPEGVCCVVRLPFGEDIHL